VAVTELLREFEVSLQALKEENAMLRDQLREERAAVVAWLNAEAKHYNAPVLGVLLFAATSIEQGAHRRQP
jgi:hypothetical protein